MVGLNIVNCTLMAEKFFFDFSSEKNAEIKEV